MGRDRGDASARVTATAARPAAATATGAGPPGRARPRGPRPEAPAADSVRPPRTSRASRSFAPVPRCPQRPKPKRLQAGARPSPGAPGRAARRAAPDRRAQLFRGGMPACARPCRSRTRVEGRGQAGHQPDGHRAMAAGPAPPGARGRLARPGRGRARRRRRARPARPALGRDGCRRPGRSARDETHPGAGREAARPRWTGARTRSTSSGSPTSTLALDGRAGSCGPCGCRRGRPKAGVPLPDRARRPASPRRPPPRSRADAAPRPLGGGARGGRLLARPRLGHAGRPPDQRHRRAAGPW